MKNKILGIFVCMMLMVTAVPAVASLKNNAINATVPSAPLRSMVAGWTELQKLLASDGAVGDEFGVSVSLSGDTALIGSWGVDDNGGGSGAAYVFTKGGIGIDITGGLGVSAVITNNNETVTITNINWEISVKGGILGMINKIIKGTIDVIEPGKSETVGTGLLFGLSPIAITVKVSDVEKKTEGTQFFILTIIKK